MSLMPSVIRAAIRKPGQRLNIVSFGCSTEFDKALFATGHRFLVAQLPGQKTYDQPPANNVMLLDGDLGDGQLPSDFDLDLVVTPHEEFKLAAAHRLSRAILAHLICFWEKMPEANWTKPHLDFARSRTGDINVFPTQAHAEAWDVPGLVNPDLAELFWDASTKPFIWKKS